MQIEREKLLNRLVLCKKELKRAKNAICFWSKELSLVVEAIAEDKQFRFEDYLTEETDHERSE